LNCIIAGTSLFVGILITLGVDLLVENLLVFILGSIIITLISAGGFVINDIYDYEIDKINQPGRILPSGSISLKTAKLYTLILFSIGFFLSLVVLVLDTTINLGLIPPIITLVGIIFLFLYASIFKKLGIIGNLVITLLSTIPILIGGFFIDDISRSIFPSLIIVSLIYSREIIKDVEDIKGDLAGSDFMFSLPAVIGVKKTIYLGKLFLLLTVIISISPFVLEYFSYYRSWGVILFAVLLDGLILYSIILLRGSEENLIFQSKQVKIFLKIGIIVGLIGLASNPFSKIT
jgi:geranylgeranylglycerol-phosphate geranylgeranyltransferase